MLKPISSWTKFKISAQENRPSGVGRRRILATLVFASALVASTAASAPAQTSTHPPTLVHVYMSPTQGIEVDYTPENGAGQYFYPGPGQGCSNTSSWPWLTMIDLNRQTLQWKSTQCFDQSQNADLQAYLSQMTKSDLLLASTGSPLGKLNLAPIGGTDFTAQSAPQTYNYSIVGYGGASQGIAQESYNVLPFQPWHGISGTLVPVPTSTSTWTFGFQSEDPVAFAVVPNGGTASITIGNVQSPTGNPTIDSELTSGFKSVTYNSPPVMVAGMWILVLDRYTLQELNSFVVQSFMPSNGAENLLGAGQLLSTLGALTNNDLVFMTNLNAYPSGVGTIVDDVGAGYWLSLETGNSTPQYPNLLNFVQQMGVSPHAFNKAVGNDSTLGNYAPAVFSMVGIPQAFAPDPSMVGSSVSAAIPNNLTRTGGPNKEQWFSSSLDTQQGETGALQGVLMRDKAFGYAPSNVHPLDIAQLETSLGHSPTTDDLLQGNLSMAIESAPPVAWPTSATPGQQSAYQLMSKALFFSDYSTIDATTSAAWISAVCPSAGDVCNDIRFYYTGSLAAQLTKTDPNKVPCPANPSNFTCSDWSAVQNQLYTEINYVGVVGAMENVVQGINISGSNGIDGELSAAASIVSNELNQATGQPASNVGANPINIASDVLAAGSALAGAGGAFPPAQAVSGILLAASHLVTLFGDLNKTPAQPDPYVNQLSNLLADTNQTASSVATNFNNILQMSEANFFNSVTGDWQKLQLVASLGVNSNAQGWFYQLNSATFASEMQPIFAKALLKSFYLQVAGNYFSTKNVTDASYNAQYTLNQPPGYLWNPYTADYWTFHTTVAQAAGLTLDKMGDYSWDYRGSLTDYTWSYNYVVLNSNQAAPWPSTFGDMLMGNNEPGDLNLNRDVLYDSGIFPQLSTQDFNSWLTNYVANLNQIYALQQYNNNPYHRK